MKKITAVIRTLTMILSLLGVLSFAAEDGAEAADPGQDETIVRVYTYDESVRHTPSIWFNTFDYDGDCTGTDYVIFNVAAPLTGIGLPELYAGKSENHTDCTVRFELFKWNKNTGDTLSGTAVFEKDVYFDGDSKDLPYFVFDSAMPAGQYIFRITQLTGVGEDGERPYSVLPISELIYAETKLEFDTRGPFVFYAEFEKTEGITEYFLTLEGKENTIDIQPEKTVIPRGQAVAHPFFEFGILTPVIPDGQVLYSLALIEAPTWVNKNGDSDVSFDVYKWTGDYEESTYGKSLCSGEIFDHQDNSNLTLKFDTALRYGSSYLIVLTRSNNGAIGYYEGNPDYSDGWTFFEYGIELDYSPAIRVAYALVGDLGPEATEEPTEVPTEVPATDVPENPTNAPATDVPAKTDAPKTTDKGGSGDNSGKDNNGKNDGKKFPVVPVVIGGVALIAVIAIIAIAAKKKKQK